MRKMSTGKQEETLQTPEAAPTAVNKPQHTGIQPKEVGGPKGPEPTRYGDWERRGRCIDF